MTTKITRLALCETGDCTWSFQLWINDPLIDAEQRTTRRRKVYSKAQEHIDTTGHDHVGVEYVREKQESEEEGAGEGETNFDEEGEPL